MLEFEQQAYDTHENAPDSEFETIAAIQGFRYRFHGSCHELKQLPEAQSDAFAHELTALTERELQKELEQNEKSLQESLKKPGCLELSSESRSKEPEPQPASFEKEKQEEPEQKSASEAEPDVQKNPEQERTPEKKKSEGSLIYFRQNPPSSEQ